MATTKEAVAEATAARKLRCREWITHAHQWLTERQVATHEELERELLGHFADTLTPTHELEMVGSIRTRKENLCDHAKASLTRDGYTTTIDGVGRDRLIIYTPPVGSLDVCGHIIPKETAWEIAEKLSRYFRERK